MGTLQSQCCRPSFQDTDILLPEFQQPPNHQQTLSSSDSECLQNHLRQINLLSALDFQFGAVGREQLAELNSSFELIEQLIDSIELQTPLAFLNVIQSKTYHINHPQNSSRWLPRYEGCILELSSKNGITGLVSPEIIKSLKMLDLLKLECPMNQYNPEEFFKMLLEEVRSIPRAHEWLWEIEECTSLHQMVFHLRYNFSKYVSFLNSYLSLNDPTSFRHLRCFYHLVDLHFSTSLPLPLPSPKYYVCWQQGNSVESWLLKSGVFYINVSFLTFMVEERRAPSETQLQSAFSQEHLCMPVKLLLRPSSQNKLSKKFMQDEALHYLPFTMFRVQKVIRFAERVEVVLSELADQLIAKEIKIPQAVGDTQRQNHVLINQTNLANELRSLRESLNDKISQAVGQGQDGELNNSTKAQDLLLQYYQRYETLKQANKVKGNTQDLEGVKEVQEQELNNDGVVEMSSELEEQELIEFAPAEAKKKEDILMAYIQELGLQKLQNQVFSVDYFVHLKSLNLSQSWLYKIEHLDCFPNLTQLFLYSNQIQRIQGLDGNPRLRLLSLSRNRITRLENLNGLPKLRQLYLTKNQLGRSSVEYLSSLKIKSLKVLSISFCEDAETLFEVFVRRLPCRVITLIINDSSQLSTRSKNMLLKRLKGTSVIFFDN